ncbi:hypothetical protein EWW49_30720, partial [Pseudomonas syringae]
MQSRAGKGRDDPEETRQGTAASGAHQTSGGDRGGSNCAGDVNGNGRWGGRGGWLSIKTKLCAVGARKKACSGGLRSSRLANISVNRKLALGFGTVLFFTSGRALVGWTSLDKLINRADRIGDITELSDNLTN